MCLERRGTDRSSMIAGDALVSLALVRRELVIWRLGLAREDVEALGSFAAGGERAAVIPLDVEQAGALDGGDHLGWVVQHEVEVDLVAEPVSDGTYVGAGVQGEHEPAIGAQGSRERGDRGGQFGRGEVDE